MFLQELAMLLMLASYLMNNCNASFLCNIRHKLFASCRFCENNPDPNFTSCSQPQELSNEEIDKQLAGSEVGGIASECRLIACLPFCISGVNHLFKAVAA